MARLSSQAATTIQAFSCVLVWESSTAEPAQALGRLSQDVRLEGGRHGNESGRVAQFASVGGVATAAQRRDGRGKRGLGLVAQPERCGGKRHLRAAQAAGHPIEAGIDEATHGTGLHDAGSSEHGKTVGAASVSLPRDPRSRFSRSAM